jgi:Fe-S-cluster-containing hydrogenase component 2
MGCSAISRSANWSTPPPASAARPAKSRASSGTTCRSQPTTFDNTYQTMPRRLEFLEPHQVQRAPESRRHDPVADAQGSVHALRRSRLPAACPADGAIVQYANGIVDFNQENCIGCEFCVSGCPFDIPRSTRHQEGLQVHALLRPRRRRPGTGLHQGVSHRMPEVRHQGRHEVHRRGARQTTARQFRLAERRRLRSAIGRRNARYLRAARCDRPRALRRPAEESDHPVELHGVEVALQAGARHVRLVRLPRRSRPLRNRARAWPNPNRRKRMGPMSSGAVERFDDKAREIASNTSGKTTVYRGELLRHPVYTRVLHWAVALFFFLALFTGFGIYLPWLFRWFTPIFGGGPLSRDHAPLFRYRLRLLLRTASPELAPAHALDRSRFTAGCAT